MIRVIEQTYEEKLAMYLKLPKKQLAEMLIEANRHIAYKSALSNEIHLQITTYNETKH